MTRGRAKPKSCSVCGRAVSNSFICRRCGRQLRELLIGDGHTPRQSLDAAFGLSKPGQDVTKAVVAQEHNGGQPGIVWYLDRLRETAYRQASVERPLGAKSSSSGYALLGEKRAIALIAKITGTVDRWNDDLDRLVRRQSAENVVSDGIYRSVSDDVLERKQIHRIANSIPLLRHNAPDIDQLLHNLLDYAKDAWKVINRPDDICCGPCPNTYRDREIGEDVECGRMLYAEEYEQDDGKGNVIRVEADSVQCSNPKCRAKHDVSQLRESLKQRTRDTLFTGPELLSLMENRLNDRMSKSTFYQLIRDGRLRSSGFNADDESMYTYSDVCEAREKPKPSSRRLAKIKAAQ